MKKHLIAFSVSVFALAATFIAIGAYIAKYDLSSLTANKLVEKASYLGLIVVVIFYIPILLLRLSPYFFGILGALYILAGGRLIISTVIKEDLLRLYKKTRLFVYANAAFLSLIIFVDCFLIPFIYRHFNTDASVALTVFTVLINLFSVAVQITAFLFSKKLKLGLTWQGPSV